MGLLGALGLLSLAAGGLSGWLVLASSMYADRFARWGVTDPRAFLQLHLDWVLMGLVLLVVDLAVPDRPAATTAALAVGLVLNPLLFVPLAWGPQVRERLWFRAVTVVSFTAASGGLVALAVHGLRTD